MLRANLSASKWTITKKNLSIYWLRKFEFDCPRRKLQNSTAMNRFDYQDNGIKGSPYKFANFVRSRR
jgi:hypothetical protein